MALRHAVELVARLAIELLHLVRIGGRWLLSCSSRPHCWSGRRSHCGIWSSWWPAVALLPVADLVAGGDAAARCRAAGLASSRAAASGRACVLAPAWPALAEWLASLAVELLPSARISGQYLPRCSTGPNCWPAVMVLPVSVLPEVEPVACPAGAALQVVGLVASGRWSRCSTRSSWWHCWPFTCWLNLFPSENETGTLF